MVKRSNRGLLTSHLQPVGHITHPLPVVVAVRDHDDAMPAAQQALAERPDVHLHPAQPWVEKVAHHAHAVSAFFCRTERGLNEISKEDEK